MKPRAFPLSLFLLPVVFGCGGGQPSVDLGDSSIGNLTWGTYHYGFSEKDPDKAMVYADKALELYGAEARQMQGSLADFPPTDPPEATYKYKALNDLGAILLAKGEFLMEKGDRAGAEEAFTMLVQDFGYAQTQDNGEWNNYASPIPRDANNFVKLSDVAKLRLADIKAGRD